MRKYKDLELNDIQDFYNATIDLIDQYCVNGNIDPDNIHARVWDDIIQDLALKLYIPNHSFFKVEGNINNAYDSSKLYYVFMYIYRRITNKYKQTITLNNYSIMLNINKQTIYNTTCEKLSCVGLDNDKNLAEIISEYSLQSLESGLQSAKNYMQYLPTLNLRYGYNLPGTRTQEKKQDALESRESIAQIDTKSMPQLPQN